MSLFQQRETLTKLQKALYCFVVDIFLLNGSIYFFPLFLGKVSFIKALENKDCINRRFEDVCYFRFIYFKPFRCVTKCDSSLRFLLKNE